MRKSKEPTPSPRLGHQGRRPGHHLVVVSSPGAGSMGVRPPTRGRKRELRGTKATPVQVVHIISPAFVSSNFTKQ